MSEGLLYKKCFNLRKCLCIHAPEEDEKGNITQKVHDSYNYPSREQIKEVLDEAKHDYPTWKKPARAPNQYPNKRELEQALITHSLKIEKWFKKWFGSAEK